MKNKSTIQEQITQLLPAGVALNDHNIEFVGVKDTKTVIWLQHGDSHAFEHLPDNFYNMLKEDFLSDIKAIEALCQDFRSNDERRLVEIYTYYMYGDLDHTADIKDGKLQPSENFRHTKDCISLQFDHKNIDFNGIPLKPTYIKILDEFEKGTPDKMIAYKLGIAESTLDSHKRNLNNLLGAQSKTEAVAIAFKHHILCT